MIPDFQSHIVSALQDTITMAMSLTLQVRVVNYARLITTVMVMPTQSRLVQMRTRTVTPTEEEKSRCQVTVSASRGMAFLLSVDSALSVRQTFIVQATEQPVQISEALRSLLVV